MGYIKGVLTLTCIWSIVVLGLSVFTGFTGLFSLGHAAFVAVGAYTAGILTYFYRTPFIVAVMAGGAVATVVSLVIGIPTLKAKLRSDYFAIAIMGFGDAIRVILENLGITQGARGLPGLTGYTSLPVALLSLVVAAAVARNFVLSRYGWRAIAVREDPVAAEMMGIDLFRTRLASLTFSAYFAGVAGALLAHYMMFIQPVMFTGVQSTQFLASVVAGGMGSLTGPVIATAIFIIVPEFLRVANMWRLAVYGLLLIMIMIFRPRGLMGYSELSWAGIRSLGHRAKGQGVTRRA